MDKEESHKFENISYYQFLKEHVGLSDEEIQEKFIKHVEEVKKFLIHNGYTEDKEGKNE